MNEDKITIVPPQKYIDNTRNALCTVGSCGTICRDKFIVNNNYTGIRRHVRVMIILTQWPVIKNDIKYHYQIVELNKVLHPLSEKL